jgi:hypothetical protein
VKRSARLLALASALALLAACGSGGASGSPTRHGSLSAHEFAVATRIARSEAGREAKTITSATATASRGTLRDSDTGHPCTSGTLLQIKLLGTFRTAVLPPPGQHDTVTELDITADPNSGKACLISVRTHTVLPDADAAVLSIG